MPMIRTFKYPLLPNQEQEAVLTTWLDACRSLYNSALLDRQVAYANDQSTLSYYDQTTELTKMRARLPALKEVPVEVARSALRHLDREPSFAALKTAKLGWISTLQRKRTESGRSISDAR